MRLPNFITRFLFNQIGKVKTIPKIPIGNIRLNNLLGETTGVTAKIVRPKVNPNNLIKAANASNGYIRLPIRKTGFSNVKHLGERIAKSVPEGSVSVPLRSKNPDVDLVAKEMLDSKKEMKKFLQRH